MRQPYDPPPTTAPPAEPDQPVGTRAAEPDPEAVLAKLEAAFTAAEVAGIDPDTIDAARAVVGALYAHRAADLQDAANRQAAALGRTVAWLAAARGDAAEGGEQA